MTVTTSIVPHLTRAQLLEIHAWTAANERARREYENKHHLCSGQALRRSRGRNYERVVCTCHVEDHTTEARTA